MISAVKSTKNLGGKTKSYTATMPCTVRAARVTNMADQTMARTQLFELAALLIPAIEVSFPNLWHNCIVYVVERYLQRVKLKCHTADQNFVIKSRFQHRALDEQGTIVYQLLESWSSQQYEQMPTNHVAKSQSCFNKDIYLQREILVNFQIFIVALVCRQ